MYAHTLDLWPLALMVYPIPFKVDRYMRPFKRYFTYLGSRGVCYKYEKCDVGDGDLNQRVIGSSRKYLRSKSPLLPPPTPLLAWRRGSKIWIIWVTYFLYSPAYLIDKNFDRKGAVVHVSTQVRTLKITTFILLPPCMHGGYFDYLIDILFESS